MMRYDFHNTLTTQINAEKTRAFYIPYDTDNFSDDDFSSPCVKMLTDWKFSYFPKITDEAFDCTPTDDVKVPSCWQILGYDRNQYTNARYPFPYYPPHILKDNPCGVYQTNFYEKEPSGKYYINFEGADSCLYLFVNGEFVGYSTVSHSSCEFDVTPHVKKGENVVKIVVVKWCSASYLEDQDKLRMSGLFREVYVLHRPKNHLRDYFVTTDVIGKTGIIDLSLDLYSEVTLSDGEKTIDKQSGKNVRFEIENAKLWTAETPNLYTLVIFCGGEYIREFVGIRKIDTSGAVFRINGKPVKFKGVNRHSMTVDGYVESVELMVKDIMLMKQHNINAVRTSHYPPHPLFTRLCDKYGIYLLEEADVESHGATMSYYGAGWDDYNGIADLPEFKEQMLHRQYRMVERDKNRPSVVIWSIGNETGWIAEENSLMEENFAIKQSNYNNLIDTIKYLKSLDHTRPAHYQNWYVLTEDNKDHPHSLPDLNSEMYSSTAFVEHACTNKPLVPFVLCEYTHAMGNSCGDVKAYWDVIYAQEKCCGAFVWEWCNHCVKIGEKNLYGGDFGDILNDGNFCVDGLIELDRSSVHSSLKEVSEAHSPCNVLFENGKFYIENRNDFTSLDNFSCICSVTENGKTVSEKPIDITGVMPHNKKILDIDVPEKSGYKCVNFTFTDKTYGIKNVKQVVLSENYPTIRIEKGTPDYEYEIGTNGLISSLTRNGKQYLLPKTRINVWRAPIDNDTKGIWRDCFLDRAECFCVKTESTDDGLRSRVFVVYDSHLPIADVTIDYVFGKNGIKIKVVADIDEHIEDLPRFGLSFTLPKEYDSVEYFGRGPYENYEDKKHLSHVGLFESKIADLGYDYVRPQENGNRTGVRSIRISSGEKTLVVESEKDINFSIRDYDERIDYKHNFEIKRENEWYLSVDYRQCGTGSAACGPKLEDKYKIKEKHIEFSFNVIPD